MRVRAVVTCFVAAALALGGAACGDGSLEVATAPLPDGAEVPSQRYLADVDAAAAAIRDFAAVLDRVGPVARPARVRALAPGMGEAVGRANAMVDRLAAQRLADARLEAQRERALPVLREVVAAMRAVAEASAAGDAAGVTAGVAEFRAALERLEPLGGPAA
jgi:hypothetical protein